MRVRGRGRVRVRGRGRVRVRSHLEVLDDHTDEDVAQEEDAEDDVEHIVDLAGGRGSGLGWPPGLGLGLGLGLGSGGSGLG